MANKICIMFCRVSSKEQEETGYSLPAQEKYLKDYCEKHDIKIQKTFKISESASGEKQRKKFAEMMKYSHDNNIKIVICEKADRLTRNFKDMVAIDQWLDKDSERQVHLVKDSLILHRDSKSQEKLNWGIRILFAKNYIDNLSEEVKKGQKAKIEDGWLPTKPPMGYKTIGEKGKKIHVIDEEVAPFIKDMFQRYSTGNYSLLKLCEVMFEQGLKTKRGRAIPKSSMHRFLKDPFYSGQFYWKGEVYQGSHKPIISKQLFRKVQKVINRPINAPKYQKHNPLFKGKVKCGECGGMVTWERQKGTWYGHCNHYRPCKQKKYVRQEDLETMLIPLFEKISPKSERVLKWLEKVLKIIDDDQSDYNEIQIEKLRKDIEIIDSKMKEVYEDKVSKIISVEFFQEKMEEYKEQKEKIKETLDNLDDSLDEQRQKAVTIHELAYRAKPTFLNPKIDTESKREILSEIFSNLDIKDGNIAEKYTPAFEFLLKWMPTVNTTFELEEKRLTKGKTDLSQPARSVLLGVWDDVGMWLNSISLEQVR
jgi:DNA invertase Pin-like site-specific DNA recombinase